MTERHRKRLASLANVRLAREQLFRSDEPRLAKISARISGRKALGKDFKESGPSTLAAGLNTAVSY